jgi:hypothetical protein
MDAIPNTWRGVVGRYNQAPEGIRDYFESIPELIENYVWEVSLAFMFCRVEKAMNRMLYCGTVKLHRANSTTASSMVDNHHMTRNEFKKLFKNVFGIAIPKQLNDVLSEAERVRNKVVHGKAASDADMRKAIVRLLEYAEGMDDLVNRKAQFKPFSPDLRGFAGGGERLDASTTHWLMKGLGFESKAAADAELG